MDDGVLIPGIITGTHDGKWAGVPPSGNRVNVPAVETFDFDGDRLLCEKVCFDMATVQTQMGVLPAIS
jgi:predicted ester cyclase